VFGFPVPVLKQAQTTDGRTVSTVHYEYGGGRYTKATREFRGFRAVTVRHPGSSDGRPLIERIEFHQGSGLDSIPDDPSVPTGLTAGRPFRQTFEDVDGNVLGQ